MTFLKGLSIFMGTVIGAGIFGLPFIALKAGLITVFIYFLAMSFLVGAVYFFYLEIILAVKENHRLPGYVEKYLGKNWKKFSFLVVSLSLIGTILAYLIIGGKFLYSLLNPYFGGSYFLYVFIFWLLGAYLIFRSIKTISQIELSFLIFFIFILFILFIKSIPLTNFEAFQSFNWRFAFLPYGVVLFSLCGSAVIPQIKDILKANNKNIKKVKLKKRAKRIIFWGMVLSILIYLFFIFIVLGISGNQTSKDSLSGLNIALKNNIIKWAFIFGIISCFTSFITLGFSLKNTFRYDFGISKNISWFIACFTPLFLFFLGLRNFIEVIGFTGAVALGLEGLIIIFLYRRFRIKELKIKKTNPIVYLAGFVFLIGIFSEIFYFFILPSIL